MLRVFLKFLWRRNNFNDYKIDIDKIYNFWCVFYVGLM